MDIHNKEFKHSFRGYDEDDVDDYLDRIVNDYGVLMRENEKLKGDLERMRKDNAQYQKLEKNLKDTLLIAQKTADEVQTNAKENAEQMLKNTAKECQNMRHEAELKAKATLANADKSVRELQQEYNRLLQEKRLLLTKVQKMMADELAGIEATLENLPEALTTNAVQPQPAVTEAKVVATAAPAAKAEEKTTEADKAPAPQAELSEDTAVMPQTIVAPQPEETKQEHVAEKEIRI